MSSKAIQCFWKPITEFDAIIITFTDQNGRPLEIESKVNLTLLINKTALSIKQLKQQVNLQETKSLIKL